MLLPQAIRFALLARRFSVLSSSPCSYSRSTYPSQLIAHRLSFQNVRATVCLAFPASTPRKALISYLPRRVQKCTTPPLRLVLEYKGNSAMTILGDHGTSSFGFVHPYLTYFLSLPLPHSFSLLLLLLLLFFPFFRFSGHYVLIISSITALALAVGILDSTQLSSRVSMTPVFSVAAPTTSAHPFCRYSTRVRRPHFPFHPSATPTRL
jgi:hypothetical protein